MRAVEVLHRCGSLAVVVEVQRTTTLKCIPFHAKEALFPVS